MSEQLTGLLLASAARWPAFAAELTAATGVDDRLPDRGHPDGRAHRRRPGRGAPAVGVPAGLGLPVTPLRPSELRDREPALAPRVRGGALAPTDHQVDPRRLVPALRTAAQRAGAVLVPRPVRSPVRRGRARSPWSPPAAGPPR